VSAGEPIIEARAVLKTYETGKVRVAALKGIDLAVSRGEMVAIMGPSGCGKTTLLNCLSGLDSVDGGEIVIEGTPLQAMSDRDRTDYRARRMGFVFQFYNLIPSLTAQENVALVTEISRDPMRPEEALRLVRLDQRLDHFPAQLSGGEQQRVAIARAIAGNPKILLADEPTGNLDPKTSAVIYDLFLQLQGERGISFFVATHNPDLARKADRGYRLVDGLAREIDSSER
jgi:putative ABC transport system ATP-binding protein